MYISKLCVVALLALATTSTLAMIQKKQDGYSQRNVTVGQEFSVQFDVSPSQPVQWYVLMPVGPGIDFVDVKDESSTSGRRFITAPQRGGVVGGASKVRNFTFRATEPTDGAAYGIRFIKIDFSNKIFDTKTVPYKVAP